MLLTGIILLCLPIGGLAYGWFAGLCAGAGASLCLRFAYVEAREARSLWTRSGKSGASLRSAGLAVFGGVTTVAGLYFGYSVDRLDHRMGYVTWHEGSTTVVSVSGEIVPAFKARLRATVFANPPPYRICIDSNGGDANGGVAAAEFLRGQEVEIYTPHCVSACGYVFAAARRRYVVGGEDGGDQSAVGFHDFSVTNMKWIAPVMRQRLHLFFKLAGVSEQMIERIDASPHDAMWYPTLPEFQAGGVPVTSVSEAQYAEACGLPNGQPNPYTALVRRRPARANAP